MDINDDSTLQPEPTRQPEKPALAVDPHAGIDLDRARRPGYGSLRGIKPWPNSRWPIERQPGTPTSFMHGRSNKTPPPVFGTDVPPRGISGQLRRLARAYPDHMARHWMLLLASDRVDLLEHRIRKALPFAIGGLLIGLMVRRKMAPYR
jgi:hypothetical protein